MTPFTRFDIIPSYATGFAYYWQLSSGFSDPPPWEFTVEMAEVVDGPWETISPVLTNTLMWADIERRVVSKDLILFFRVKLVTPDDTYYSEPQAPYSDFLSRRDYLIGKEIMRKEVLHAKKLAGVPSYIWIEATNGAPCESCVDPITGSKLTSNCKDCLGAGVNPPYLGPYGIWATYSPLRRGTQVKPDGTGTFDPVGVVIRMIGFPYAKDGDIVIDPKSDKRFLVEGVRHIMEIRRTPIVQELVTKELPTADPRYKLGTPAQGEEGCELP